MDGTSESSALPIVSTRVIGFPREVVFRAFSEPDVLARWWGPSGSTNTFEVFDFRPGGAWRFVMHAPDGADYLMTHEFVDIVPPERVSFRHVQVGHDFEMTMTFADEDGGTRITWAMVFASADEADRVRDFIVVANEQNLDRLEAELSRIQETV
jgi:uncharacterized protein YndB with AHSA1/START domain